MDDCDEPEVKMQHRTQTLLLEASDSGSYSMIDHGEMWNGWLKKELPHTIERTGDELTIIHSITPYVHKRRRE